MSAGRSVEVKREDGGQMTLADVREFVAEMDAAGATEGTPITATIGWTGSKLKALKATAVRFGDKVPDNIAGLQ